MFPAVRRACICPGVDQTQDLFPWPQGGIVVHPEQSNLLVVGWRSPIDGFVSISGGVTNIDNGGGDGVAWFIDKGGTTLSSGSVGNGGAQDFANGSGGAAALTGVPVQQGDYLYFLVDQRADMNYDTTRLDVGITQVRYVYLPVVIRP